jgi:hypothetical protein
MSKLFIPFSTDDQCLASTKEVNKKYISFLKDLRESLILVNKKSIDIDKLTNIINKSLKDTYTTKKAVKVEKVEKAVKVEKAEKVEKVEIKCKGLTKQNKPCTRKALDGESYCKTHLNDTDKLVVENKNEEEEILLPKKEYLDKKKKEKSSEKLLKSVADDEITIKKREPFDFKNKSPVNITDRNFWIVNKLNERVKNMCRTFLIEGSSNLYVNHKATGFVISQSADKNYYLIGEYIEGSTFISVDKMDLIKVEWAIKCGLKIQNNQTESDTEETVYNDGDTEEEN